MAKKYHQTRKDREDESRGMRRRMREGGRKSESYRFVEGNDPMVGKDSFAGLPSEVMMREYPRSRMNRGGYLDDSMREIDAIQDGSEAQLERHLSHQK